MEPNNQNVSVNQFICDEHMHCESLKSNDTHESPIIIRKEFKYSISRNLIGSLLKFVFKITYEQSLDVKYSTFTITDFNFGDPCYDMSKVCIDKQTEKCIPISFGVTNYKCECQKDEKGNHKYYGTKCGKIQFCFNDVSGVSCSF